jgi:hypothetical protein
VVVLTKADQVPRGRRPARVAGIAAAVGVDTDAPVVTSAYSREGAEELRDAVLGLLD